MCNSAGGSVLREASLSLDLVLMTGMENLSSALTSGVRLFVSISHSSGIGARISDCFLCCSFKTWLRLVLFNLVLVLAKKIGVSACGSILSPSLTLTCYFVVEREKTVDWVLTWLIWSPQYCVHLCTLSAASCIMYAADVVYSAELQIARSSVWRVFETCLGITVVMLLI